MKKLLTYFAIIFLMASCSPVMVYETGKSENYNIKQAKNIIASQKKVRKKQLRVMQKNRKKELHEIKAMSRVNKK